MKSYTCSKCKAVTHSGKDPVFCICGGRYSETRTVIMGAIDDIFNQFGFMGAGNESIHS